MKYLLYILLIISSINAFSQSKNTSQSLKIKSYSIGVKIFELTPVGNDPFSIEPQLKNPEEYRSYRNTISYNGIFSNPEIRWVPAIYFVAELTKNTQSRFWKKNTIETGLFLTPVIRRQTGVLSEEYFTYNPDPIKTTNQYSLVKRYQIAGITLGLKRRYQIINRLNFATGFNVQGGVAFLHKIEQKWDSSTFTPSGGWIHNYSKRPDLKGKNYFEYQAMIPLGLEYEIKKNKIYIRTEVNFGIINNQFLATAVKPKREAHGFGFWLLYRP